MRDKNLLMFYPHNFYEMSSGTHRRVFDLLEYLKKRGFSIDLLSLNGFTNRWGAEDLAKRDLVDSINVCEWKLSVKNKMSLELDHRRGRLPDLAISALKEKFKEMTDRKNYGFVVISYVYWAALAELAAAGTVKVIDMHDFVTLNNYLLSEKKEFGLGLMFQGEVNAISRFDYALSISEEEKLMLGPFCPDTAFIDAPMSYPPKTGAGDAPEIDLLFIGSENAFNRNGMKWFMDNVYGLLPGTVRIGIVGKIGGYVEKKNNIEILNHVSDLDEIYKRAKLTFCPLRGGTGLKVKVIESLSYGTPVVTTSWGLTGILQKKDNGCVVADRPEDFANAIKLLLDDEEEYKKARACAKKFFMTRYSPEVVYKNLDSVFAGDTAQS